jgi:hypothetical protein
VKVENQARSELTAISQQRAKTRVSMARVLHVCLEEGILQREKQAPVMSHLPRGGYGRFPRIESSVPVDFVAGDAVPMVVLHARLTWWWKRITASIWLELLRSARLNRESES